MLGYPLASALVLVSLPPYQGMRRIAGNNGYLVVDYLTSAKRVAAVAAALFVFSLVWVYVAQRGRSRVSVRVLMGYRAGHFRSMLVPVLAAHSRQGGFRVCSEQIWVRDHHNLLDDAQHSGWHRYSTSAGPDQGQANRSPSGSTGPSWFPARSSAPVRSAWQCLMHDHFLQDSRRPCPGTIRHRSRAIGHRRPRGSSQLRGRVARGLRNSGLPLLRVSTWLRLGRTRIGNACINGDGSGVQSQVAGRLSMSGVGSPSMPPHAERPDLSTSWSSWTTRAI